MVIYHYRQFKSAPHCRPLGRSSKAGQPEQPPFGFLAAQCRAFHFVSLSPKVSSSDEKKKNMLPYKKVPSRQKVGAHTPLFSEALIVINFTIYG